jgi:hypothetical protein
MARSRFVEVLPQLLVGAEGWRVAAAAGREVDAG